MENLKQRFEAFLETAASPETRDIKELKELFILAGHKVGKCESDTCINNMLNEVRKYYHVHFNALTTPEIKRRYILAPGNHQFAPGDAVLHNNDNTTDEDIDWYLIHYPHVKQLLIN